MGTPHEIQSAVPWSEELPVIMGINERAIFGIESIHSPAFIQVYKRTPVEKKKKKLGIVTNGIDGSKLVTNARNGIQES